MQTEDQPSPKHCGHMPGRDVIETAKMSDKLKAVLDARSDSSNLIFPHTDALQHPGLAQAGNGIALSIHEVSPIRHSERAALLIQQRIRGMHHTVTVG